MDHPLFIARKRGRVIEEDQCNTDFLMHGEVHVVTWLQSVPGLRLFRRAKAWLSLRSAGMTAE
jgi:hypothetical protein